MSSIMLSRRTLCYAVYLVTSAIMSTVIAQSLSTMTSGMVMTISPSSSSSMASMASMASSAMMEPSSTSTAAPTDYTVTVGKGDHRFIPEVLSANIGDTIHFEFFPTNHSVIRSTWDQPCQPYEDYNISDPNGAIWSGWQPVSMVMEDFEMPWWNYTITFSDPIFLYCGAPGSCNQRGMVMIINGNSSYPINTLRKNSLAAPYVLLPGEPFPSSEATANSMISTTTPTTFVSSTSPSSTTTTSPTVTAAKTSSHMSISVGAIAGIVIGGIACIGIIGGLFFFIGRRRPSQEARDRAMVAEMIHNNARHSGNPYFSPASPAHPAPVAARETVIIPMTEAEKAMYLERIHAMSPVPNTTGSPIHERDMRNTFTSPHTAPVEM